MSDSLDKNPFYRSLVTQFQDLFTLANKECSMICVPRSSSLKGVSLSKQFISSHLLKQSPLLRSHLVPLDSSQVKDVEERDKKLIVNNAKCAKIHEIEIISSEDAFNSNNKLYHINVIDRPMTFPFIENIYQTGAEESEESVISLNECKLYLMRISAQKFRQLMSAAQKHLPTLTVTPSNLDQVSMNFASFIENQIQIFTTEDAAIDEDIVKYSVESVIISIVTEKLMNAIRAKYHDSTQRIEAQMKLIRKKNYKLNNFGSHFRFKLGSDYSDAKDILSRLNFTYTAIEKVSILKDFISSTKKQLEELVEKSRSPFDASPPTPVLSEDLVAATVLILSNLECSDVYCHFKFVQLFGNQLPSTDEMAFSVVTVEAALQIIETFDTCTTRTERNSKESPTLRSPIPPTSNRTPELPKKVDPKFDRKLRRLNKLLSDVTSEDGNSPTVSTSSRGSNDDEELGEFLSSLKVSKYQVHNGKLN